MLLRSYEFFGPILTVYIAPDIADFADGGFGFRWPISFAKVPMESLATIGLFQPEKLPQPPRRPASDDHGPVHGPALRAALDPALMVHGLCRAR